MCWSGLYFGWWIVGCDFAILFDTLLFGCVSQHFCCFVSGRFGCWVFWVCTLSLVFPGGMLSNCEVCGLVWFVWGILGLLIWFCVFAIVV